MTNATQNIIKDKSIKPSLLGPDPQYNLRSSQSTTPLNPPVLGPDPKHILPIIQTSLTVCKNFEFPDHDGMYHLLVYRYISFIFLPLNSYLAKFKPKYNFL